MRLILAVAVVLAGCSAEPTEIENDELPADEFAEPGPPPASDEMADMLISCATTTEGGATMTSMYIGVNGAPMGYSKGNEEPYRMCSPERADCYTIVKDGSFVSHKESFDGEVKEISINLDTMAYSEKTTAADGAETVGGEGTTCEQVPYPDNVAAPSAF